MQGACLDDDAIAALVDGHLDEPAAALARAHLGSCEPCRRLVSAAVDSVMAVGRRGDLASTASESIVPGALIAGKYRVDRRIASGGMGRVFEAWQLRLERRVAIKVVLPGLAGDPMATARFCREARIASLLTSDGAIKVHDLGALASGEPYLVMELLEGEDLGAILSRGPVGPDVAREWVRSAAQTIGEAHSYGIVHRDLKPGNLFLARGPHGARIKVLDFGLAKLEGASRDALTAAGLGLGSPSYMAPEQVSSAATVDARADVWALGVTLFEAVAGRLPFEGRDLDELLDHIARRPSPPLKEIVRDVDPKLDAIVARCLAKDPRARFADATELALALASVKDGGTAVMAPLQVATSEPARTLGRYALEERLGSGAHGVVFRARQRPLGREVAVKILQREASPVAVQRFERESAIVQRLEHPNTVRLYDAGSSDDGAPFLVFELVRGRSLASEIASCPMAPARVARIATQILNALTEAHEAGVVHRDLKPSNVMLVDHAGEADYVKLLDFGVARATDESRAAGDVKPITDDGGLVGTPLYMAPEQLRGALVDARADLYALGLIMAEALSGAPVFGGIPPVAVYAAKTSGALPSLAPAVQASPLGSVISRALASDPRARFASAREMAHAISAALSNASSASGATSHGQWARPSAPPATRSWLAVAVALALVGGGLVAILVLAIGYRSVSARRPQGDSWSPPTGPPLDSVGNGPIARLDEARLRRRLTEVGWTVPTGSSQDFGTGCRWTDLQADSPATSTHVFLFVCATRELAAHESSRLRRGQGWSILEENRVLHCGGDEKDARALCEKILDPN